MSNSIKLHDKDREIEHLREMYARNTDRIKDLNRIIELSEDRIKDLEAELSARGKFSYKQVIQTFNHLKVHH